MGVDQIGDSCSVSYIHGIIYIGYADSERHATTVYAVNMFSAFKITETS